jgi:hypothetical protein
VKRRRAKAKQSAQRKGCLFDLKLSLDDAYRKIDSFIFAFEFHVMFYCFFDLHVNRNFIIDRQKYMSTNVNAILIWLFEWDDDLNLSFKMLALEILQH